MKFIPILFSTPMVQAIQEGRKTITRRMAKLELINKEPDNLRYVCNTNDDYFIDRPAIKYDDRVWYQWHRFNTNEFTYVVRCPYKIGDILWVRETFYAFGKWVKNGKTKSGKQKYKFIDCTSSNGFSYQYADTVKENINPLGISTKKDGVIRWYKRPSLFMPKAACRIFLKITGVKVERVQSITGIDAVKEGVRSRLPENGIAQQEFADLWQSINGVDSWYSNPLVWCISFEKISKT